MISFNITFRYFFLNLVSITVKERYQLLRNNQNETKYNYDRNY